MYTGAMNRKKSRKEYSHTHFLIYYNIYSIIDKRQAFSQSNSHASQNQVVACTSGAALWSVSKSNIGATTIK